MKGIVLAGGLGTRLAPITAVTSKQLLPVYDKPMIYYPMSVLMLAGIRDIMIISAPDSLVQIEQLFGDGSRLGLNVSYGRQEDPRGIADAYVIGAEHVAGEQSALVLGDNIFHGAGFQGLLAEATKNTDGCVLFSYPVAEPERYAVVDTDPEGNIRSICEKPGEPRSHNAVTGLYIYDSDVVEIAKSIKPSPRGELEITDVNKAYVDMQKASLVELGRGFTWLDAGTCDSLLEASNYVRVLRKRQGIQVACLEEVAMRMGFIDVEACIKLGAEMGVSEYGRYVMETAMAFDGSDARGAG